MDFDYSEKQIYWRDRVRAFMDEHVMPNQALYEEQAEHARRNGWTPIPLLQELSAKAKEAGLWNLFLPPSPEHDTQEFHGAGLSTLEYAPAAEEMGRLLWAPRVFNCSSPDTGNMELLHRFGSQQQKERWLRPLLAGEIRSAFLMTEPQVASSDATNIETRIERDGDHYVINGRKWFSSGFGGSQAELAIVMGKTDPSAPPHKQQSMILVPSDTPGIKIVRNLLVFGFEDNHPHPELILENVRVPAENLIYGEGRGFEIAQGRLGPGRIHHCMRAIGAAEEVLGKMVRRLQDRVAWGKPLAEQSIWDERIANARADIEMCRLLVLKAAAMVDSVGAKAARTEIALIKAVVPRSVLKIIDDAIQAYGGAGVTPDYGLARLFAHYRVLRIADGPDEVHQRQIARLEHRKYRDPKSVAR